MSGEKASDCCSFRRGQLQSSGRSSARVAITASALLLMLRDSRQQIHSSRYSAQHGTMRALGADHAGSCTLSGKQKAALAPGVDVPIPFRCGRILKLGISTQSKRVQSPTCDFRLHWVSNEYTISGTFSAIGLGVSSWRAWIYDTKRRNNFADDLGISELLVNLTPLGVSPDVAEEAAAPPILVKIEKVEAAVRRADLQRSTRSSQDLLDKRGIARPSQDNFFMSACPTFRQRESSDRSQLLGGQRWSKLNSTAFIKTRQNSYRHGHKCERRIEDFAFRRVHADLPITLFHATNCFIHMNLDVSAKMIDEGLEALPNDESILAVVFHICRDRGHRATCAEVLHAVDLPRDHLPHACEHVWPGARPSGILPDLLALVAIAHVARHRDCRHVPEGGDVAEMPATHAIHHSPFALCKHRFWSPPSFALPVEYFCKGFFKKSVQVLLRASCCCSAACS
mmetsp:Transcript_147346/g.274570  ORF Transcript_147346/g.274570 Transcript_147346/m.274570 type:complete len:454 (-) Transcript_147346:555-1916(-)